MIILSLWFTVTFGSARTDRRWKTSGSRFCKKNSLEVGAWIEETISGTLTPDKRELGRLLSHIRKDDLIIIHYITNNQNNHVPQNFLIKFASRANAL